MRLAVWTQDSSHRAPVVSYGRARFFVDASHELLLTVAPLHLARIQVRIPVAEGCSGDMPRPKSVQLQLSFIAAQIGILQAISRWLLRCGGNAYLRRITIQISSSCL